MIVDQGEQAQLLRRTLGECSWEFMKRPAMIDGQRSCRSLCRRSVTMLAPLLLAVIDFPGRTSAQGGSRVGEERCRANEVPLGQGIDWERAGAIGEIYQSGSCRIQELESL